MERAVLQLPSRAGRLHATDHVWWTLFMDLVAIVSGLQFCDWWPH